MKKLALGIGVLLLMAMVLPAMAEPALIINDFACGVLNADGQVFWTSDSHAVITHSENDNQNLVCKAQLAPYMTFPKKAVKYTYEDIPILCGTIYGATDDWTNIITPSGQVTLTCHYKAV